MQTKNESGQDPLNYPPKLDNQLAYLYGYVGFSDGSPTSGALTRYADLEAELKEQHPSPSGAVSALAIRVRAEMRVKRRSCESESATPVRTMP